MELPWPSALLGVLLYGILPGLLMELVLYSQRIKWVAFMDIFHSSALLRLVVTEPLSQSLFDYSFSAPPPPRRWNSSCCWTRKWNPYTDTQEYIQGRTRKSDSGQSHSNDIYQLFLATILCPDGETPTTKILEEWPKITLSSRNEAYKCTLNPLKA